MEQFYDEDVNEQYTSFLCQHIISGNRKDGFEYYSSSELEQSNQEMIRMKNGNLAFIVEEEDEWDVVKGLWVHPVTDEIAHVSDLELETNS